MAKVTLVIAEAGVNHNGSPELALKLVDVAADAGADQRLKLVAHVGKRSRGQDRAARFQLVDRLPQCRRVPLIDGPLHRVEQHGRVVDVAVDQIRQNGLRVLPQHLADLVERLEVDRGARRELLGCEWW